MVSISLLIPNWYVHVWTWKVDLLCILFVILYIMFQSVSYHPLSPGSPLITRLWLANIFWGVWAYSLLCLVNIWFLRAEISRFDFKFCKLTCAELHKLYTKIYSLYFFLFLCLHHGQNMIQDQSLSRVNLVWISESFYSSAKELSLPNFFIQRRTGRKYGFILFPRGISIKWNTNSLVQDFNFSL